MLASLALNIPTSAITWPPPTKSDFFTGSGLDTKMDFLDESSTERTKQGGRRLMKHTFQKKILEKKRQTNESYLLYSHLNDSYMSETRWSNFEP